MFELADLPLDFREGLRRFNGNTHDQASSVCGSVVGYKALGRKLATKAKNAMRRVRGAGAVGRPRMRRVGKRWQTCVGRFEAPRCFRFILTCRTRYSFSRVRDRMLR